MGEKTHDAGSGTRRRMLMGLAAVAGGAVALQAGTPARAAAGGSFTLGTQNDAGDASTKLTSGAGATYGTLYLENTSGYGIPLAVKPNDYGISIDGPAEYSSLFIKAGAVGFSQPRPRSPSRDAQNPTLGSPG